MENATMWSGYFCGLKTILSVEKIPKQNFKTIFCSTKNEKNKSFWPKSLVNPFGKYAKMRLSEVAIFMGLRGFSSVERIPKQNFKIIFAPKQKLNKIKFFDQNAEMGLSEVLILLGYIRFFSIEKIWTHYFKMIFP